VMTAWPHGLHARREKHHRENASQPVRSPSPGGLIPTLAACEIGYDVPRGTSLCLSVCRCLSQARQAKRLARLVRRRRAKGPTWERQTYDVGVVRETLTAIVGHQLDYRVPILVAH